MSYRTISSVVNGYMFKVYGDLDIDRTLPCVEFLYTMQPTLLFHCTMASIIVDRDYQARRTLALNDLWCKCEFKLSSVRLH